MNLSNAFTVAEFSRNSTHLVFLGKTPRPPDRAPHKYFSLAHQGSRIPLSRVGHEKLPPGSTLSERIVNLVNGALLYHEEEYKMKKQFLENILLDKPGWLTNK